MGMRVKQSAITVSLAVFLLIVISTPGMALDIGYYGIDSQITDDGTVANSVTFQFNEPVASFGYTFNYEIYDLNAESDFNWVNCELSVQGGKSLVSCEFMGMSETKKTLTMDFKTMRVVKPVDDKYRYLARYEIPSNMERFFVSVKLPQNGILAEEIPSESFFPSDGNIYTDGKNIIVYWEKYDLTQGDIIEFSILYTVPLAVGMFYNVVIVAMIIVIAAVIMSIIFYIRRGPRTADAVKAVLSRDEKVIVDILNMYKGKIGQKIIVRESDFSKAKVSRLVKNLTERGVVHTEPISGRENRVMLKFGE